MITLNRVAQNNRIIDLHCHSWFSDGALSPPDLARRMRHAGVKIAALTDHDTMEGVPAFRREAALHGMKTLSGVEVSCRCSELEGSPEVHVLVYGIDPGHTEFEAWLDSIRISRRDRVLAMLEKLRELGFPLNPERLKQDLERGSIGRPHLARLLVQDGHVKSVGEAFFRFLATDRPACLPKVLPEARELLPLVREWNGVSILAHPGKGLPENGTRKLMHLGVDGLEAYHPSHRGGMQQTLHDQARLNRLSVSAGSDFHDPKQGRYRAPNWGSDQVGGRLASLLQKA